MAGRVQDKVAIITGAASGIGRASAELLAREGAAVGVADLNGAGAKEVADGINASGGRAIPIEVDIEQEESGAAIVAAGADPAGGGGPPGGGRPGAPGAPGGARPGPPPGPPGGPARRSCPGGPPATRWCRASASRRTWPTPCCSWPPTSRPTSPATSSGS